MSKETDERLLRKAYSEIINGFSVYQYRGKDIYIKHTGNIDNLEVDYLYTKYYEDAVRKGYPTEEDSIAILKRDGLWSDALEDEIKSLKETIKDLFASKRKAFRRSDIDSFNKQIKETEEKLLAKISLRETRIGSTAEKFSRRKVDAFFISTSFYKDKKLEHLLFAPEEFDNLETEEVDEIYTIYYEAANALHESQIKKMAISDFFVNVFHLAENIWQFFGKPLATLTYYQIQLCAYGNFFKNILQSDPKPPEDIASDPEKLEDWHFGRSNAEEELKRLKKDGDEDSTVSLVGLSNEDRKFLGYEEPERVNVRDKIKDAGGELSMQEIMKLDGV